MDALGPCGSDRNTSVPTVTNGETTTAVTGWGGKVAETLDGRLTTGRPVVVPYTPTIAARRYCPRRAKPTDAELTVTIARARSGGLVSTRSNGKPGFYRTRNTSGSP